MQIYIDTCIKQTVPLFTFGSRYGEYIDNDSHKVSFEPKKDVSLLSSE